MKLPKLKWLKYQLPKPPKAIRTAFKLYGKSAHNLQTDKVAVHVLGHLADHVLERVVTNTPA